MTNLKENIRWQNWAGTCESRPAKIFFPESVEEITELVCKARSSSTSIRVIGAGHSFTPLAHTDEWLISLDRLCGIISVDSERLTATVWGGTRLKQISEVLGKMGFAQENLGDINVQSIAGAISTGTHGTGLTFGNISTQVTELTLVTASGQVVNMTEQSHPALFQGALLSLGLLGIIVKAVIRIIPSPLYMFSSQKVNYGRLIDSLDSLIKDNRHFEFFLFPYSDTVQIKTMNITDGKAQSLRFHRAQNLVTENYLFYALSETCRLLPAASPFFSRLSAKGVGKSSVMAESHRLFATPRKVKFTEMEYAIPLETIKPALSDIRRKIMLERYHVHFPIECRMVKADQIWLSPSYERDSAYIAFHMYKGMPYEDYFRDMEEIMDAYGGRPHWGKLHTKKLDKLSSLYPKLPAFLKARQELDPEGMFANPYLRDMFSLV